jgi:hypothetical protein
MGPNRSYQARIRHLGSARVFWGIFGGRLSNVKKVDAIGFKSPIP